MATIVKTTAGTWKAVIRKTGWPTNAKTFRTKRAPRIGLIAQKTRWYVASTYNAAVPSA